MRSPDRNLTALEGAALAVVARLGTATRFMVSKDFLDSPSEYFSGSAGAVYPLITRLIARGLMQEIPAAGRRTKSLIQLTDQGRALMEEWLLDVNGAAHIGYDPLRTRLVNLDLVERPVGRQFLQDMLERIDADATAYSAAAGYAHDEMGLRAWLEARRTYIRTYLELWERTGPAA